MQKNKLSKLDQCDGKLRKEEEQDFPQYEPTTLAVLLGEVNGSERYGTLDIEEYKNQISAENMNMAELRRHAVEVAHIVPAVSRERLEKRLILEFQKHVAGFTVPKVTHKKEKEPSKEALKIMSEVK